MQSPRGGVLKHRIRTPGVGTTKHSRSRHLRRLPDYGQRRLLSALAGQGLRMLQDEQDAAEIVKKILCEAAATFSRLRGTER
jgi:hypothetical protein